MNEHFYILIRTEDRMFTVPSPKLVDRFHQLLMIASGQWDDKTTREKFIDECVALVYKTNTKSDPETVTNYKKRLNKNVVNLKKWRQK